MSLTVMKTKFLLFPILILFLGVNEIAGQSKEEKIVQLKAQIKENRKQFEDLRGRMGALKLEYYKEDYRDNIGLPTNDYIEHKAMFLEYSEMHEQPKWVAHVILPEISDVGKGRTNDFREDPLVLSGTAVEVDYFLKRMLADSTFEYDGFGWDRGHLAPSADFRWSEEAVSESYYYSNMSPMVAEFNREIWSDLESMLRQYVLNNKVPLYVVTAPILHDDLKKIERSVNGISIPEKFIKVALDIANRRAIGFVIRNEKAESPLDAYATTVDYIEELSGYDFFTVMDEDIESQIDKSAWFTDTNLGFVEPISPNHLKDGYFNTVFGGRKKGLHKKVKVCGTVVGSRYSRSGNGWLNLDRKYPNDYFSIMIKKDKLNNFDFDPIIELINEKHCFEGEVIEIGKKPGIIISKQNQIIDFTDPTQY